MKLSNILPACIAVVGTLIVTIFTGCASSSQSSPIYRSEHQSTGGVRVQSIHLRTNDGRLTVSGTVGRSVGYGNSPRRHLDVEVVDANGAVLERKATNFTPNPIRHNPRTQTSSAYAVTLPQVPPQGSVVRVVVHATALSDCRY